MNAREAKGFHGKAGWYFRRGPAGEVTVYPPAGDAVTFDPGGWASIVAGLSAAGEGHETYHAALDLHVSTEAAVEG